MPQPIEYIEDEAGFERGRYHHSNGRKVTRLNTQVAALAIFESKLLAPTNYELMLVTLSLAIEEWAKKPGRRSSKRRFWQENPNATLHRYRLPMEFLKPWIEREYPNLTWVPTTWIGAKEQLHLDAGVFEEDIALARLSSDEVVTVFNGVAHFPWDPNSTLAFGKSRMVYGYWTQS